MPLFQKVMKKLLIEKLTRLYLKATFTEET